MAISITKIELEVGYLDYWFKRYGKAKIHGFKKSGRADLRSKYAWLGNKLKATNATEARRRVKVAYETAGDIGEGPLRDVVDYIIESKRPRRAVKLVTEPDPKIESKGCRPCKEHTNCWENTHVFRLEKKTSGKNAMAKASADGTNLTFQPRVFVTYHVTGDAD